ncbi:MAG: hypothetical protein AAF927_17250 [Bacteroidota bacterium]
MLIPPNHLNQNAAKVNPDVGVYFQSSHICFAAEVVNQVFKAEDNAYMAHYPDKGYLLFAPVSSPFFKKMHPATQHMLKAKNLKGSKSIALHELIIDHELSFTEGALQYEILEKANMLKIQLP